MRHNITERDKALVLQTTLSYKYRLFIVDTNKNVLDEIQGVSSIGSYDITSDSDVRRTTSFDLYLDAKYSTMSIEKKLFSWIGYSFQVQIGIYSIRDDDYVWYDCGYYLITQANTNYDATTNSMSLNLSDWFSKLNGTRNGQIGGAPVISIPNVDTDGNPVTLKVATQNLIASETDFSDFIIDDIGEYYGMPQNNPDYETYRATYTNWNQLAYDLEYEAGCNIGEILDEIVNMYPNCQMYFDIYGNFCYDMIPSGEYDIVSLDNEYLQKVLVTPSAEGVAYDISSIRNVTEVFGATYDIDRFATTVSRSSSLYTATLTSYTAYSSGDMIAFTPSSTNIASMRFRVNSLASLPIYYEYTTTYIDAGILTANETYVLQIRNTADGYVAYYLGQYQPHALCVLTADENDEKYTKSYFATKYNCNENNVVFRTEAESPFTVQKLGEILDVKTGDEFDNILSDSVARENAIYCNRNSSSVQDTVTLTTKMMPFLDVNMKVSYKKQQDTEEHEYIIKSISNDTGGTSTITMYRFYPLYMS